MPVRREVLEALESDRSADHDTEHRPNSPWVSQGEQNAEGGGNAVVRQRAGPGMMGLPGLQA